MGKAEHSLAGPATPETSGVTCFHCGLPVPPGVELTIDIRGEAQPLCCPGCHAVAHLIADSGLAGFYRQRTAYAPRPEPGHPQQDFSAWDNPEVNAGFVRSTENGLQADLMLGGMTCAACTWLIEKTLLRLEGVSAAAVRLDEQRLSVEFDPKTIALRRIASEIAALGYTVEPFYRSELSDRLRRELRTDLARLGVAGIGMMQVGMFAIALHAGDLQGMEASYRGLMRWVSLAFATLVVAYSARSFFESAWRHLRAGALVMDLPVALALSLALAASAWATVTGQGQVYFDSVVMFTFFLLLARFVDRRIRTRSVQAWVDVETQLPAAVSVSENGHWVTRARRLIARGDQLLVPSGSVIPADMRVTRGRSAVREETFNGEPVPRAVAEGDTVYAGTLNVDGSLEGEVLAPYAESRLAALQRSIERARLAKPRLARWADRIAGVFVGAVLVVAAVTAGIWLWVEPARALWVSLSVLVVSCPCALSIATPTALANAALALRRAGVLTYSEDALTSAATVTDVVFDKTGTLTEGKLQIVLVQPLANMPEPDILARVAALQRHVVHPVAEACLAAMPTTPLVAKDVTSEPGSGVAGIIDGASYRVGSRAYCEAAGAAMTPPPDETLYWVAVSRDSEPLAWIGLEDSARGEARDVIEQLRRRGLRLHLLTGDASGRGQRLAAKLGLDAQVSGCSPEDKVAYVQRLQSAGACVLAVGDGLNDAPLLRAADASLAITGATDLARAEADFVVESGDLGQVTRLLSGASGFRRILRQNLAWALGYNLAAIPIAAAGLVPPWAAAIGMSLSSLGVVLNSTRQLRRGRDGGA